MCLFVWEKGPGSARVCLEWDSNPDSPKPLFQGHWTDGHVRSPLEGGECVEVSRVRWVGPIVGTG